MKDFRSVLSLEDLQDIRRMIDSTHAPDHVLDLIERIDINIEYAKGKTWVVSERTRQARKRVRIRKMRSTNPLD